MFDSASWSFRLNILFLCRRLFWVICMLNTLNKSFFVCLGDILDLAWSLQDRYLASSSVDNTVIIWDMNSYQAITTLKGHSGLVKGVAWDPVKKYFRTIIWIIFFSKIVWWVACNKNRAISIEGRSIFGITERWSNCASVANQRLGLRKSDQWTIWRMWRNNTRFTAFLVTGWFILGISTCDEWRYAITILGEQTTKNSFDRNSVNPKTFNWFLFLGGPTAQIIERKGWKCDKDFVGHRKAVNCVVRTHSSH